jgi:hypothetical protein
VDFAQLKADIQVLERNDFAAIKADNERLSIETEKLAQMLREDVQRLQAGTRLDINLDRGRIFDETAELEYARHECRGVMIEFD